MCVVDLHPLSLVTAMQDVEAVLQAEFPAGIDLVYEGVGGAMQTAALRNLAPNGRLLVVGYISEYPHNDRCTSAVPNHRLSGSLTSPQG